MGRICIFEDDGYRNFLPLVHLRAVFELRFGIDLLFQKIIRRYPGAAMSFFCRDHIASLVAHNHGLPVNDVREEGCLFINARFCLDTNIPLEGDEEIGMVGDSMAYARFGPQKSGRITPVFCLDEGFPEFMRKMNVKVKDCDAFMAEYPWDFILSNPARIGEDFNEMVEGGALRGTMRGEVHPEACVVEPNNVFMGEGSVVYPFSVIDGKSGPVYIGDHVTVHPNSTIQGPVSICSGSKVKAGTRIGGGTSIGEVCKIGGEVEESIVLSYSNKQHDGFLGHSYIGSWCNIGAGTVTSDLKNDYGPVRVRVNGTAVDTGKMFVGLIMGDHAKSGINTMFNTGTVVGTASNIFGGGFPPKYIPPFSWGGAENMETYKLEKALSTARAVMARRGIELSAEEEELLRALFDMTIHERM